MVRSTRQSDEASAGVISGLLGQLPLALNQAAAYVLQRQMPLSEYASLVKERLDEVLHSLPASPEQQRVTSTWSLSLEQVAKSSPAAEELLRLCSFLGAESIPLELMTNSAFVFPRPKRRYLIPSGPSPLAVAVRNPLQLNEAIGVLLRFSLLTRRRNGVLDVHRLVQAVVRRSLDEEARTHWAGVALAAVRAAYPKNSGDWGRGPPAPPWCPTPWPRSLMPREARPVLATRAGYYTEWPPTFGVEPSSPAQKPTSSAPSPYTWPPTAPTTPHQPLLPRT